MQSGISSMTNCPGRIARARSGASNVTEKRPGEKDRRRRSGARWSAFTDRELYPVSDLHRGVRVLRLPLPPQLFEAFLAEQAPLELPRGTRVVSASVTAAQSPMVGVEIDNRLGFPSNHVASPFETPLPKHGPYPNLKRLEKSLLSKQRFAGL